MMKKKCTKCKETKSIDNFSHSNVSSDRLHSWCKNCKRLHNKNKRRDILREFSITEVDYEIMFKKQGGVCAICNQSEIAKDGYGGVRQLAVDHRHEPFKIRGLLCANCNRGIGLLKENPEILRKAAEYLEKHS